VSDGRATLGTPDLAAVAAEAEVELVVARSIEIVELTPDDTTLGYYEAELTSLRDAALTVQEAEHPVP
jgi:hypothetical protein